MTERADAGDGGAQRNDHARGERVAKVIARAGLASRREAERWISEGRVRVNAHLIASPAVTVTAQDVVAVDGQTLPRRERTRLFLFHKPRGFLTSHHDPRGRQTVFDLLPKGLPRLISVGRLDLNTEGLMLLTNDGNLARVLELPSTGWLRRYRVRAHGQVTQHALDALRDGIAIDGIRYGAIEAGIDRVQGSNAWMTFAIREGKNREVKNVLGHLGLAVNRLIRVSFGPFQLRDLPPGQIDEVKTRVLRDQLGARIAALANADFSAPGGQEMIRDTLQETMQHTMQDPKKEATFSRHARNASPAADAQKPAPRPGRPRPSRGQDVKSRDKRGRDGRAPKRRGDHIGEPERARREKRRAPGRSRQKRR